MRTDRVRRAVAPTIVLLALAVALMIIGMAATGAAQAASHDKAPRGAVSVQTRDAIIEFGDPVRIAVDERVGSVISFGGDVTVAGTVTHTIVAFGGDVRLLPTAVVGGALSETDASVVAMGGTITVAEGAQVTGDLQRIDEGNWSEFVDVAVPNVDVRSWAAFSFVGWLVQAAIFLVLGLVAAALLPKQMLAIGRALSARPGAALGWGALTFFIVVPVAAVVLFISIVGILLLIPAIVVVPLFYFFVVASVAAFIAQRLMSGTGRNENLMLATTLGVVGTAIVSRIPVGGGLALLVMTLFGTGAAGMAMLEWRRGRRTIAVPAPAPAPAGGPAGGGEESTVVVAPLAAGANPENMDTEEKEQT